MFDFVETKKVQTKARVAVNSHVYINSYRTFLIALKKLKITICKYKAGMESESVSNTLSPSRLPLFVSNLDALVLNAYIEKTIIVPSKIASLNEMIRSSSMSFAFKSVDPAIFTNDVEKNPIPTTVRKEINAHASDA
ncbi:hypothetical protein [Pseudomonas sp. QTF5]|uniref:hypothetical protein n=1 Tax=Pseudomonas sp. QTF5 TaxID=1435425 RepID=UPI0021143427|nr:hypothetical protein [Pseudomonas sp. QTF5]